jgi:hypothetical protein
VVPKNTSTNKTLTCGSENSIMLSRDSVHCSKRCLIRLGKIKSDLIRSVDNIDIHVIWQSPDNKESIHVNMELRVLNRLI